MASIHKIENDVLRRLKSQTLVISPASAVRELVQNSVDSRATKIEIVLDLNNLELIICDDGDGISLHNLNILGTAHATSKISNLNDLQRLATYGYRGEAICSIAGVSSMTIASKDKHYDSTWVRRLPNVAQILDFNERDLEGHPDFKLKSFKKNESGTVVLVKNLLHNLPVRRKYFQKYPAYKTHMMIKQDLFQVLLLHPHIEISLDVIDDNGKKRNLVHSQNIISTYTLHEKMSSVFLNVYGAIVTPESIKKVAITFKEYQIDGLISKVPVRSKDFQFVFVNGRRQKDPAFLRILDNMFQAVGFGYDNSNTSAVKSVGRPYDTHPMLIFHVRCPHNIDDLMQDSDKNVWNLSRSHIIHPLILKIVESFLKHQGYNTIRRNGHIRNSISTKKHVPFVSSSIFDSRICPSRTAGKRLSSRLRGSLCVAKVAFRPILSQFYFQKITNLGPFEIKSARNSKGSFFNINRLNEEQSKFDCTSTKEFLNIKIQRSQLKCAEVVNQVGKKFILLRLPGTRLASHSLLIIVDQHAVDERIKLEFYLKQFLKDIISGTIAIHSLHGCNILLNSTEVDLFEHFKPEFKKWGMTYKLRKEDSGVCCLNLISLPQTVHQKYKGDKVFLKGALLQTVNDIKCSKRLPFAMEEAKIRLQKSPDEFQWWNYIDSIPVIFRELFNSRACRSAIMFGDTLSKGECAVLINDLANCKFPFQCAHGRPSVIPLAELKPIEGGTGGVTERIQPNCPDYNIDI
ncbi:hypothetical protein HG535_0A06230 [Zygotorulaspora mrakii]|uniref:MutL C-terminal dimerisation domain-containing protein n=1 Tax=Zygotorulaspora mrakii TaxID=42260 RepID=A0A7H9AWN3_ZYGMR|nr:uncharacterized protein HG535_0A06230 [Zygotorulaspora mrakii]QLG70681.1 hypothetical protein HG535_0A06230 [Zygotorulaspora mrakii]